MKYLLTTLLLLLQVCSAFGQRPDPASIRMNEDTLKGITAMSVMVEVEGITDIPESTYIADIESRLKAVGITILPPTSSPRTYPCLVLFVQGFFATTTGGGSVGSIVNHQLEFFQLIPQRTGSQTVYIRGITYAIKASVRGSSMSIGSILRESYVEQVDDFVRDYKKVNQPR